MLKADVGGEWCGCEVTAGGSKPRCQCVIGAIQGSRLFRIGARCARRSTRALGRPRDRASPTRSSEGAKSSVRTESSHERRGRCPVDRGDGQAARRALGAFLSGSTSPWHLWAMDPNLLSVVAQLSTQELVARVTQLAQREREATAALIAHLAELDARRLYLAEGYSSLFTYCTQVLHLSEHAAYGRISKRQVEALIARLRPQPPVPASVRRLPTASPTTAQPPAPPEAAASPQLAGTGPGVTSSVGPPPLAIAPPPVAAPDSGRGAGGDRRSGADGARAGPVRCRAHNGDEAEQYFGRRPPAHVREMRAPSVPPTEPPRPPSRLEIGGHSVRTECGAGPLRSPDRSGRAVQHHAGSDG